MVHGRAGGMLDRFRVEFDDERAVANAGLLLSASLAGRLGIEALVNETVDLAGRPGAAGAGRQVLALVHAMQLGAGSINDFDVLLSGRPVLMLRHLLPMPSSLGAFRRAVR